ncbi:hypothetical protein G9A89_009004 [Geosiphon pyriformis]|nr:hypothetical protein G9A89_009004 [Geosiphon pyriformis]
MATSVISMKELVQDISKEINICIDQIIPQIPPKEVFESVEDEVNQNSLQFQWALEKLEDPSHNIESQTLKFFRLAKILQIELEKIIFAERNKEERALKDEIACLQKEVEHKRKVWFHKSQT